MSGQKEQLKEASMGLAGVIALGDREELAEQHELIKTWAMCWLKLEAAAAKALRIKSVVQGFRTESLATTEEVTEETSS